MVRRKVDPTARAAFDLIRSLLNPSQLPDFLYETQVLSTLESLYQRWEQEGFPNIWDDREVFHDEENGSRTYKGLYYEMLETCDSLGLPWPQGGQLLTRALNQRIEWGKYTDLELPPGLPPKEHWKWFRMAQTGMGAPHQNELLYLIKQVSSGSRIKTENGLSYKLIAYIHSNQTGEFLHTRNIAAAIKTCWEYLDLGVNINKVVEHAGFSELEYWLLIIVYSMSLPEQIKPPLTKKKHFPEKVAHSRFEILSSQEKVMPEQNAMSSLKSEFLNYEDPLS